MSFKLFLTIFSANTFSLIVGSEYFFYKLANERERAKKDLNEAIDGYLKKIKSLPKDAAINAFHSTYDFAKNLNLKRQ